MQFYLSRETTSRALDVYDKLSNHFDQDEIPRINIGSCAGDDAPPMISKNAGYLELMKDKNSSIALSPRKSQWKKMLPLNYTKC